MQGGWTRTAFSATNRTSTSGITVTSPFDSLVGYHDVDIDLTDNTDAGFYATACRYIVTLAPDTETVDGQTITGIPLAYFEITPSLTVTTFTVSGATTLNSLVVSNAATFNGAVSLASTLGIVGTVSLTGSVSATHASNDIRGIKLTSAGLDLILPAEPTTVPTWGSTTLVGWLSWLGAWSRNKVTSTSSTQILRNDADSSSIATITQSDDGTTYTSGEAS